MTPLVQRALDLAVTQIGVREHGRNRGPEIDGYNHDIGHDPAKADPWCAIFVCAMFRRAARELGVLCPVPMTAGCWTLDEKSPKPVHTVVPVAGAIFLLSRHRHTGFVSEVLAGDRLRTVEGNTNGGGSADGDGVYERERSRTEIEIYLDFSRLGI